ncbi:MAG: PHP domain-containing protein, partial [candidate division NC10 bacterium]
MALLKGNLHTHTHLSDGLLSPEAVIARYRALGYDFLAITDHDDRIGEDYWH